MLLYMLLALVLYGLNICVEKGNPYHRGIHRKHHNLNLASQINVNPKPNFYQLASYKLAAARSAVQQITRSC
ncbi:hypothetical protein EV426DRAFT_603237 [Tirmania nivea]|nr:hypothetical protein EV426DRAFT_603237 [Tirmania nivea]